MKNQKKKKRNEWQNKESKEFLFLTTLCGERHFDVISLAGTAAVAVTVTDTATKYYCLSQS